MPHLQIISSARLCLKVFLLSSPKIKAMTSIAMMDNDAKSWSLCNESAFELLLSLGNEFKGFRG